MAIARARRIELGIDGGRRALVVGGVVQSVAVPATGPFGSGYWPAMLPETRPESALLLGLGGGTLAHLLVARFGPLPMVGVDNDLSVLLFAREAFDWARLPLAVVCADAFQFTASCRGRFDYIAIDLFRGDAPSPGILAQPFLEDIWRLLNPGGTAVFNLWRRPRMPRRLARLERVFPPPLVLSPGGNVVAHVSRPLAATPGAFAAPRANRVRPRQSPNRPAKS